MSVTLLGLSKEQLPSSLAHIPFVDGDEMRQDGWLWNNGKKRRKWYEILRSEDGGVLGTIWKPKLNQLNELEATRWRAWLHSTCHVATEVCDAIMAFNKVERAHAYNRRHPSWLYYTSTTDGFTYEIVPEPATPLNQAIGDRLLRAQQRNLDLNRRKYVATCAFWQAVHTCIDPLLTNVYDVDDTGYIDINGRRYWLRVEGHKHKVRWVPIVQPETDVGAINLTG